MTCTPVRVGEVRAIVCTSRRKPRLCACGREAPYLCDEPSRARARAKTCDQPVCDRCVVPLGDNRHRCPACELRARTTASAPPPPPPPAVHAPKGRELGREQVGLFGFAPSSPPPPVVQSPTTASVPTASPGWTRSADLSRSSSTPAAGSSRWVICPDRITGSMDAADVDPDGWRAPALRMVAEERVSVGLYEVLDSGSWARRGGMGLDGRAA